MNRMSDAVAQDGQYPRPQLVRDSWLDLSGEWDFAIGNDPSQHPDSVVFDRTIVVPFPPESSASGIGETGYLPVAWYRRSFGQEALKAAGISDVRPRVALHFGAVDWIADVWLDGYYLGRHEGGQTPFSFTISTADAVDHVLIVRAADDPHDVSVLRGKQDWREHPHSIWYERTTGIWQPVWLEALPSVAVATLDWATDIPGATVTARVGLDASPAEVAWAHVVLRHDGELLAETRVRVLGSLTEIPLVLGVQRNGQRYEELLWSPASPTLIAAEITLETEEGKAVDEVASYLGLRSVSVADGHVLLNDRPILIRSVLAQNYWPESHLAAPDRDGLRREAELIRALGFNSARVHQKAEDPRFLYWADRLGIMIWAETAAAYAFDERAISALVTEWTDLVRRDRSHPSIIAWVPLNESWGIQHIAHDSRQRSFSVAMTELTRALDDSRLVISNDGWEHTDSDLWTVHDYEGDPEIVSERYSNDVAVRRMFAGMGPAGRRMNLGGADRGQPIVLSEFGGVSLRDPDDSEGWGYSSARDLPDFEKRVTALIRAAGSAPALSGFCYTQLADTGQETNGLVDAARRPKIPVESVRAAVLGIPTSAPNP